MGWLSKIFSGDGGQKAKPPEQALIVHFGYGDTDLSPLFALEKKLESAISEAGVGEYDGNEMATEGSDG